MKLRDKVAAIFLARPNEWIDARELVAVAGFGGWRTRKNECEHQLGMTILNRQFRRNGFTVSEYKFVPAVALRQAGLFTEAAQ